MANSASGNRSEKEDGTDQMNTSRREASRREAIDEGIDLKKKAASKQAFFRMKMDLEENRRELGKGNIVAFLLNVGGNQTVEKKDINKVLRCSGFVTDQVLGITRNDYRPNQIEVLFKEEVSIDTLNIESRLKANGLDVIVSKFEHVEEYLNIYGLPLSRDMEYVEEKIRESIRPFVKSVLEVTPCLHKEELGEDFFKGNYDGNWRVKVIPRKRKQIPNYIVVDSRSQVMAKAVYTKKVSDKLEMCSDCFSTEHFKWDPACKGPAKWSEYCEDFRVVWETNSLEIDEAGDEIARREGNVMEESRVEVLNKTLVKDLERIETERDELRRKINDDREVLEEVESLKEEMKTLQNEKEMLVKEIEESNILIKEKHITMRKSCSQNGIVSRFENENMDLGSEAHLSQGFEEEVVFQEREEKQDASDGVVQPKVDEVTDSSEKELSHESASEEKKLGVDIGVPPAGGSDPKSQKREHTSSAGDSPPVKKKDGRGPKTGVIIWVDTLAGKKKYYVVQKKVKKAEDLNFILLNEEKKRVTLNLRDTSWEYDAQDNDLGGK